MVATPREDDAKDEWQQYCLAKDQARHEYEVLYSKEGSRNAFFLILAVIGLPAILLAIGLPTYTANGWGYATTTAQRS